MTTQFQPEQKQIKPRSNRTLIAYLSFVTKGPHKSEEQRLFREETHRRLRAWLKYLQAEFDGVVGVRVFGHDLGGLIPVGRSTVTQVMVEFTRLHVLDTIRATLRTDGEARRLFEELLERVDTCSTEIVYELPRDLNEG